jgi:hypothetical protein
VLTVVAHGYTWLMYSRDRLAEPPLRLGLAATLGLVAPVSWYVLGFSHSVIHTFITPTLLYFPWAILGTLFVVVALRDLALRSWASSPPFGRPMQ